MPELGFVVALVGPQTLLLVPLAFIPMFFSSWANKEMNRADPDCGTSFTWAARALGPRTGWYLGGWGTIASALLAMASYSQITGQYLFLFVGAKHIGNDATSIWVLLVGLLFVYWGWDTTVSVNEETADADSIPGTAGVLSTVILLATYFMVILSVQLFAGFGTRGIGLGNPNHVNDVLSPLGSAIFGSSALGTVLARLLLLMVMSSSAATAMTTILPNARTTLSMAFHKALPPIFGRIHPRYLTPTFSTTSFAAISAVMYLAINWVSGGNVISDSVTACTFFVAIYLGVTGFACFWWYRKSLLSSARSFWLQGVFPLLSGIMLFVILGWSVYFYTDPDQSYTTWHMPFWPHWTIGGVLSIGIVTALVGLAWMLSLQRKYREFFSGRSMREGVSITDDDKVVTVSAAD
jgi:amino acid transporter